MAIKELKITFESEENSVKLKNLTNCLVIDSNGDISEACYISGEWIEIGSLTHSGGEDVIENVKWFYINERLNKK